MICNKGKEKVGLQNEKGERRHTREGKKDKK